jgi:hypothetical protein
MQYKLALSVADTRCLIRVLDLDFSIPDRQHKLTKNFKKLTNFFSKLSEINSEMLISEFFPSRKNHRIRNTAVNKNKNKIPDFQRMKKIRIGLDLDRHQN